jgi:hypothetical protein
MVHRKRKFTEVDGAILLESTEVFGRALSNAQDSAPFGSEIYSAIENLWGAVRHVQITLTGRSAVRICADTQHALEPAAEGTEAEDVGHHSLVEAAGREEVAFCGPPLKHRCPACTF